MITYGPDESRCMYAENAPQAIHWAELDGDPKAVSAELIHAIKANIPRASWPDAIGDARALLERFELCAAVCPEDVKYISSVSDLWEMRLRLEPYGVEIRIYETEIATLPTNIVALRVHRKEIFPNSEDATRSAQNAHIQVAAGRWRDGYATRWGLA